MKRYRTELLLVLSGVVVLVLFFLSQRNALEEKGLSKLAGITGVPLDDAYIHTRYAENLLVGNGSTFNPGSGIVTADTSSLWVALIALGGLFTSRLEVVAVLLSALFYLLLVIAAYRFSLQVGIPRNWAIVAALLTLLSGRIIWSGMSGMEITLASLLTIAALGAHLRGDSLREGCFLALGVAARPELLLLAAVLFADSLFRITKRQDELQTLLRSLVVFMIFVIPVFLLPLVERGSLLYHSSIVQGAHVRGAIDAGYLWFAAKILFATVAPPFVIGLFSIYLFRNDSRYRAIQLFAFGLPVALAIVAPQYRHHGRYFFPAIPLIIILGVAVFARLLQDKKPIWVAAVLFLLLFQTALVAIRWNRIYAYSVTNITGQQVAAADWVRKNTAITDVVAAHDVGALGYFTKRPIIDLVGLVTPEFYPLQHDQRLVWQKARSMGANVFVIYNRLNPTFYEFAKDSLTLAASFRAEPLVASADTVMNIYRVRTDAAY